METGRHRPRCGLPLRSWQAPSPPRALTPGSPKWLQSRSKLRAAAERPPSVTAAKGSDHEGAQSPARFCPTPSDFCDSMGAGPGIAAALPTDSRAATCERPARGSMTPPAAASTGGRLRPSPRLAQAGRTAPSPSLPFAGCLGSPQPSEKRSEGGGKATRGVPPLVGQKQNQTNKKTLTDKEL